MQVLHRNGEHRDSAAQASPAAVTPADVGESDVIDTELEIRASHITAAAVAAAAVTAAVATMAPLPEPAAPMRPVHADPVAQPATQAMPQPTSITATAPVKALSLRAAVGNILTVAVAALAWWGADRLPLPAHGLQPALQHLSLPSLPSLRKPGSVPPANVPVAVAPPVQQAVVVEAPEPRDAIAVLQQDAEMRAQQLAERRAASQARREREDAASAAREQRRRDAEAQLADARARAERAPATVDTPAVVVTPAVPPLAEAVRQCSALSVFAREGCLWKLCSGKWGKDGCPSYQHDNEGA
ncbi:hypothetical protein [Herbaspirillum sp. YR522]|uniref:hypothetical protein n=1 Tax=Herbaspirillum sp. YR522 TaxID=1144342 RepID=UPI00026F4A92|nr:hypothetical protein [Herbaspirillum sp. YR522]EJN07480.1 hypothetical protein PMI40_01839 [Herbaspirillum sp. YR522]